MQPEEVRVIVAEVLAAQAALAPPVDAVVMKTIATILTSFGIEEDDRKELQADFRHLRKWRLSVDAATGLTLKVVVGTLVSGFVAMVWVGFKIAIGK